MAVFCNLFDESVWSALVANHSGVSTGVSVVSAGDPADAQAEFLDPCVSCPLRGLCDDDDCAMKCYPLGCIARRGWRYVLGLKPSQCLPCAPCRSHIGKPRSPEGLRGRSPGLKPLAHPPPLLVVGSFRLTH